MRSLGASVLALIMLVLVSVVAHASGVAGEAQGGAVRMTVDRSEQVARENVSVPPELRLFNYERAPQCREVAGIWTMGSADGTCPELADLAGVIQQCEDGDTMVLPMWRQARATPADAWGPWQQIDAGGCGVDLLPVLTEADFRLLPIPAPTLTLQHDRGWVNRPGFRGGSQPTEDESHGSTEEVSGRASRACDADGGRGAS